MSTYELHGNKVEDPCPECDVGLLIETDMGLACDSCEWDDVDPAKFPQKERDDAIQGEEDLHHAG